MRTTLNIPDDVMTAAMAVTRFRSKTDTIIFALQELRRRAALDELKSLAGRIDVHVDLAKSRRRPAAGRRA